jgi:hypothetical protein
MTRKEASEKIAKLERLASGTTNSHEAENARAQAARLASEHCLTDNDLKVGKMGAAFDDMVDEIGKLASSIPGGLFGAGSVVREVLRAIKDVDEVDKQSRVRQITTLVKAISLVAGDVPLVAQLKSTVDNILRAHDLPTT